MHSTILISHEFYTNKVGYVINPDNDALNEVFITPEEVSAEILKKIKQIAESYIGDEVIGAVVAIPAFFQTAQIEATKRAVQMAGLELKMLVREPTAAAIAYNEDKKLEDSNIMIFDFGGGSYIIFI
ncbi:hypothetical protein WR25_15097 [Diploscapter pachys]|uniref:Uncharacterized protein n=1 Tax=Diploscapter pachys TaxID=2018661 RepID=A0A2A2KTX5_9BILA|nr:hypothetical protein WR25_15097 [Diploscapter pachys]